MIFVSIDVVLNGIFFSRKDEKIKFLGFVFV